MKRYFDTKTKTETHIESETTIISTDVRVADFFKPLPDGFKLELVDGDFPIIVEIPKKSEDTLLNESIKLQQKAFNNAIQTHLDSKAKEFRYDNIMSARSYAGYDNQFQEEAQQLAVWASNCWVKAGEIEADVQAGNRDMPTIDEVLTELPIYE